MQVRFYVTRTQRDNPGQDLAATIILAPDGQLTMTGEGDYLDLLFDHGERAAGREAVEKAMRDAPYRFSGGYLRAAFEE